MFHLVFVSTDEDEDVDANLNKQLDAWRGLTWQMS
jgi:hypothetical protein